MSEKTREVAESAFQKYQRREAEIAVALREEQARHDAAIKNMHRLRSLRLQHEAEAPPLKGKSLQTKSVQSKSLQTRASATKASLTKPSPTKPSQTRSSQTRSSQTRSSQTKSRKTA